MFGSLVAVGITALVGIQVIINIAVVTSSMPATGMPLPFFSYGERRCLFCYVRWEFFLIFRVLALRVEKIITICLYERK